MLESNFQNFNLYNAWTITYKIYRSKVGVKYQSFKYEHHLKSIIKLLDFISL